MCDREGCQPNVVIPFAKHVTERERKVERFNLLKPTGYAMNQQV
jgi:hypothetical protein